MSRELAELLFPNVLETVEELLKKYPPRKLPEGAMVTRFAPSPTGTMHVGNFYGAIIDYQLANQSNGVFILRIEDTDEKRQSEDGIKNIFKIMTDYDVCFGEGPLSYEKQIGDYGPYIQSQRKDLYQVFAKELVARGKAYPCFCGTEDDGENLKEDFREEQRKLGLPTGYYGRWAKCRNLSFDEVKARVDAGDQFTIRIKADGDGRERVVLTDLVRGKISIPKNYVDFVILKSDGQALYHMGHLVDDTLMHVTHVVRDESYFSTWPLHVQMFEYMGLTPPAYIHTAQVMTQDRETGNVRKLSKRYDPWAGMVKIIEDGYVGAAVKEYVLNLANSSFEPWRTANAGASLSEFKLSFANMGKSGALFDQAKFENVSRNVIASMSGEEIFKHALAWAEKYDEEFASILKKDPDYAISVFGMDKNPDPKRQRKDITTLKELKTFYSYMFKELHVPNCSFDEKFSGETIAKVLSSFVRHFKLPDDNWFSKVKIVADECGFASDMKDFKMNSEKYLGSVRDVSTLIRVAITGRDQTPDLYCIMQILGEREVVLRIEDCIKAL